MLAYERRALAGMFFKTSFTPRALTSSNASQS